ncbi:MAG: hypothetical protein KAG98_07245 [Lentisphaeria bacterium]|nr:hypothetical protein [Lentisphaeria bacterium]
MFKKLFLILSLTLVVSGCAAVDSILADGDDQEDDQPWNTPSSWEGQSYGLPY